MKTTMLMSTFTTNVYLANESGDEKQNQNTVMISTVTEKRVWHEGGQEGQLSSCLSNFHFPQLHLNGLLRQIRVFEHKNDKTTLISLSELYLTLA